MVSVSECWSWSRTVGNLLRNILKLQPETVQWPQAVQTTGSTVATDSTDNRQYRQQTVQTTDSTDNSLSWTRLPLPRAWTPVYWCAVAGVEGTLAAAPELTTDHWPSTPPMVKLSFLAAACSCFLAGSVSWPAAEQRRALLTFPPATPPTRSSHHPARTRHLELGPRKGAPVSVS